MYYPYFRGKQFDLLALKSLLEMEQLSLEVQPVIEPIRQSKTFGIQLSCFRKSASFLLSSIHRRGLSDGRRKSFITNTA